jgi:hypothetical protein
VILCEALIDALTFWCAGYRNVTASYGVEGFTTDHLVLFKQCGVQRVLIAYDRDEAGDRAAEKLAKQLMTEGLDCYRILFPKGLDANEYALKVGPAAKSLGVAIRSAQWLGKGAASDTAITTLGPAPCVETKPVEVPPVAVPMLPTAAALNLPLAAKEDIRPQLPMTPPLPAAVIPPVPPPAPQVTTRPLGSNPVCEQVICFADRRYRVRGLDKNLAYEVLKVNVLVSRVSRDADDAGLGEAVHVDTLDLYQARHRATFAQGAAAELGLAQEVIKADLGKLLLALEGAGEVDRSGADAGGRPGRADGGGRTRSRARPVETPRSDRADRR